MDLIKTKVPIAFFFYFLLILFFGYQVGTGDSIEFIGYSVVKGISIFQTKDLFVMDMVSMPVNERWAVAGVISLLPDNYPVFYLITHAALTIVLLLGLGELVSIYISSTYVKFLVVFFSVIFFYGWNTGANELYHNNLQSTTFSTAAGVWGLVYFLKSRYSLAYFLTLISLVFQPVEGFHLMILFFGVSMVGFLMDKRQFKKMIVSLLFTSISFAYILYLLSNQNVNGGGLEATEYFRTVFEMRFPHHFIPHAFSKKGILLNSVLIVVSLIFYFQRDKQVFWFILLMALGVIVYCLDLYLGFHLLTPSWWFRSTIWLRVLGFIAVGSVVWQFFSDYLLKYLAIGITAISILVLFFLFKENILSGSYYHIGERYKAIDKEIDICIKLNNSAPEIAVIAQPFEFTANTYYGRRPSVLSYKAIPRTKNGIAIWSKRVKEVYQVTPGKYESSEIIDSANANFSKVSTEYLKSLGVTHVIANKESIVEGELIEANEKFKIVKI